ncbi:hypothetical protein F4819DRAFT_312482 [Hypoxylon fuscum]|nr:hypothetical protein F4819DRAFT_312482 [Hypoxylon fuscum]
MDHLDTRISRLERELEEKEGRISRLETEVTEQRESRDRPLAITCPQEDRLRSDLAEATEKLEQAEERELGLANFFSEWSGCDPCCELWVDFVRAVAKSNEVAVPISNAAPQRPWTLLQSWGEDRQQPLCAPSPISSGRSGSVQAAGKLYDSAWNTPFNDEALFALGVVAKRLTEGTCARTTPILLAFEAYSTLLDRINLSQVDAPIQLFFVGLQQAASLLDSRWPSVRASRVLNYIKHRVESLPFLRLAELLRSGVGLEAKFRDEAPSEECFYSADLRIGLLDLPQIPDWIFVIDFANESVRMVHRTRGVWRDVRGALHCVFEAPESGRDISIPIQNHFGWFVTHVPPRNDW